MLSYHLSRQNYLAVLSLPSCMLTWWNIRHIFLLFSQITFASQLFPIHMVQTYGTLSLRYHQIEQKQWVLVVARDYTHCCFLSPFVSHLLPLFLIPKQHLPPWKKKTNSKWLAHLKLIRLCLLNNREGTTWTIWTMREIKISMAQSCYEYLPPLQYLPVLQLG